MAGVAAGVEAVQVLHPTQVAALGRVPAGGVGGDDHDPGDRAGLDGGVDPAGVGREHASVGGVDDRELLGLRVPRRPVDRHPARLTQRVALDRVLDEGSAQLLVGGHRRRRVGAPEPPVGVGTLAERRLALRIEGPEAVGQHHLARPLGADGEHQQRVAAARPATSLTAVGLAADPPHGDLEHGADDGADHRPLADERQLVPVDPRRAALSRHAGSQLGGGRIPPHPGEGGAFGQALAVGHPLAGGPAVELLHLVAQLRDRRDAQLRPHVVGHPWVELGQDRLALVGAHDGAEALGPALVERDAVGAGGEQRPGLGLAALVGPPGEVAGERQVGRLSLLHEQPGGAPRVAGVELARRGVGAGASAGHRHRPGRRRGPGGARGGRGSRRAGRSGPRRRGPRHPRPGRAVRRAVGGWWSRSSPETRLRRIGLSRSSWRRACRRR